MISKKKRNSILATCHLPLATTLAIAVSGGADSMALLLLAHEWTKEKNSKAIALTVDHGLRKESAAEAIQVHEWCEKRGIEHHVLQWKHPSNQQPTTSNQAIAREARYQLLTGWCKKHGVKHLLTAHHRDDQAETFFFRLARGSGIEGLACMPEVSDMHGIQLIRPLLRVSKSELKAFLKEQNQPWIEDPSNQSPRYTRNRIRAAIAACDNAEEISQRAAELAAYFGRIRTIMEEELARLMPQVVEFTKDGAFLHLEAFLQLPPVYGLKMLSLLARTLGNKPYPPRSEKLERLYGDIVHGRIRKQRTFGGLLLIARTYKLLIKPEPKVLEKQTVEPHID